MPDLDGTWDLFVLGAGPGGYAAAFAAADHGLGVALCDLEANPGGVCLYRGCIPSKALLHAAAIIRESRRASIMGIDFADPSIDVEHLRRWQDGVVQRLTAGLGGLARTRRIHYLQGRATLLDAHRARIVAADGSSSEVLFEHLLVATGSRPVMPPEFAAESPRIVEASTALHLDQVPRRLLIVGGGYIGTELATIYTAIGARVTLVEITPGLLPGMDRELARVLEAKLKAEIAELMLGTAVLAAEDTGAAVRVQFSTGATAEYDRVLVAVGRRPNTEGFGLELSGARLNRQGFVEVDEERRSGSGTTFAVGDVTGPPLLAHKASSEGRVAAAVMAGHEERYRPRAVPSVVYTAPEVAWCGLSEGEAAIQGHRVRTTSFPWAASGRAWTEGHTEGMTKLVFDEEAGTILGVGIVGAGAGELIAEGVLAVEIGLRAQDLATVIHPHPTLSETMMEAAELYGGHATHYYGRQRMSADRSG